MRISDSKIDEIRSASDIIEVISGYTGLKKRGKNFLGLCPFHQEKTPSFTVSAEKQMYHCFGCGVGGNVFTFIMQSEKVSFVEAVRTLAERAGISLPSEQEGAGEQTENEKLYNACRRVGIHFYDNLTKTSEGKLGLEYFHHRGFTDDTIRKFGLGYSMHSWDDVIRLAQREGIDSTTLETAGLAVRREEGSGYYDRFRGRAMFPIFSPHGRVIGFGARKLREDDQLGKYMNSPETPIYDKSRSLYGLFQAKDAIREKEFAILVEGYADLISLFQTGFENVVASSGTALTEEQILVVSRYAKNITLVYDADSAGSKATMRGVDLVIEKGLEVRVASLPQGEDPDSFVRKQGKSAFQKLLDDSVSFLDFKTGQFRALGMLNSPEGQTRAVRSIIETIARIGDQLKQHLYIKHLSETYGIYESVLLTELERQMKQSARRPNPRQTSVSRQGDLPHSQPMQPSPVRVIRPAERDLLKLMLEHGSSMVRFILDSIRPEDFTDPAGKEILALLIRQTEEDHDWTADMLMNKIENEGIKKMIAGLMFNRYEISKGWAEIDSLPEEVDPKIVAERCLAIIHGEKLDVRIRENQQKMRDAAAKGEEVKEYLEKHQELLNEKKRAVV